jgi:quinolinate synthase
MFRIDPPHVLWVLESLVDGHVVNQVKVPDAIASDARIGLDRMLQIR